MARRVSSPSFVGRADELAALDSALDRAQASEAGVVLVAGESGVGKTRLVAALVANAPAETLVLQGDCVELGEGELPYAPIVGALRDVTRVTDPAAIATLPASVRNELGRLVPELAPDGGPAGAPFRPALFEGTLALLARLAEARPVLLVIEDLHWADRSTRDLFVFLARNLGRERVLVLATYRTDELHRRHPLRGVLPQIERLPRTERVVLDRLSRAEIGDQIAGILGATPDADLVRRVHARSEGNPFFAEELVASGTDGPLPDSLRDALIVRIESLSDAAKSVLRVLAAARRPISEALLAAVLHADGDTLFDWLREAVDHHIVSVRDDDFRFRHALFGEAVYDDLLPGERARVHRALAEALSADPALARASASIAAAELAHHWRAAHALPQALAAAVVAGSASRSAGAQAEAERQFGAALDLWESVPDAEGHAGVDRATLMQYAGEAAHLSGEFDRGAALLTQAADAFEAAGDVNAAALAQTRLGRCVWSAGRTAEALAAHARAVELMPATPTAQRAEVLALQARVLMLRDRVTDSLPLAEEALAIARATGARAAEGNALNTLGFDVGYLGDRERGIAHLREALAIAVELGFPDELGSAYLNLADQLDQAGRIEEAAELAIAGMEASKSAGTGRVMGAFLASEVVLRLTRLGRYDEAGQIVAVAMSLNPDGVPEVALRHARAQLRLERGDIEAASAELERIREFVERTADSQFIGPFAATDVELALWRGDSDGAAARAARGVSLLGDGFFAFSVAPLFAHALRAEADRRGRARALGRPESGERTHELLQGLARLLDAGPGPEVHAWDALARAEAERANGAEPTAAFAAAADRFAELGITFRTAYARMREVEGALAHGERARDVAERLGVARTLADQIDAPLLRAEIDALARRGRVRLAADPAPEPSDDSRQSHDPFGLTPRELEVLELVAEGHTNREIGERLYMSSKTASVHVSRILDKLAVRNRGEAAASAHRLGLTGLKRTAP